MAITKFRTSTLRSPQSKFSSFFAGNDTAFELIETQTVGAGGSASITFSNIPQYYKHLELRGVAAATFTGPDVDTIWMRFNSDSGNNYSDHGLFGIGSGTPTSFGNASQTFARGGLLRLNSTADNIFGATVVQILDYGSTSKNKTVRTLAGMDANGSGNVGMYSSAWLNSSTAITSITLLYSTRTLRQYSTFSLMGIK